MRNISIVAGLVLGALSGAAVAATAERATAKEAEAMVKKGVAYIKANPHDKAFADISDPKGQFVDRDLYLVVYRLDGMNLAHGYNRKFIGKNMIDLQDSDGKLFHRERIELAKTQTSFWQDLKFVDPLSKKIEPKQTYCERTADMLVCGGIYKP
ncbi:cache domain-containing protein [Caenimonas terrae]|uniref:Cache domain-containing protein n=1 Tax=Caenimonas terrae TaxID=696074 RepID=A0ABW0ND68_9BURK